MRSLITSPLSSNSMSQVMELLFNACDNGKSQHRDCSGYRKYRKALEEMSMYKKLTVIVDRGMAGRVMDVAHNGRQGRYNHARRTVGAEYTEKLFGVEIEPKRNWF